MTDIKLSALRVPLPTTFLSSLEDLKGFDRTAFEKVHADGQRVVSIRLNPGKTPDIAGIAVSESGAPGGESEPGTMARMGLPGGERVPWSSWGYYLDERPSFTLDPLFHGGAYYVQEASSMFLEEVLHQTADLSRPLKALDLCAAPGGKSTLLQSLLSPGSLLVSNEVIRGRSGILVENMVKWGGANVIVTQNDPRDFGALKNYFDVIVVDAPCSGSGLFRREPEAIEEWSPENVTLCQGRQQRILADCWPALKRDGLLIYSTCSYSQQEDEDILDWVLETFPATGCQLKLPEEWHIVETTGRAGGWGYRFYPDKIKGEGFFISAIRKEGDAAGDKQDRIPAGYGRNRKAALEKLSRKDEQQVLPWLKKDISPVFFRYQEHIYSLPSHLQEDLPFLQSSLYVKKAGVLMGKLSPKEFIPEHELALSQWIREDLPQIAVSRQEALKYLRKEEIQAGEGQKGWMLVSCQGLFLGWIKALAGRVNNYYPKEWRILKKDPGGSPGMIDKDL